MKKSVTIWLIAAAALIVIGGLLIAGVMAGNHWDFTALGHPVVKDLETRTFDIREDFSAVAVRSDTSDLTFLPSEDGNCSVVFCVPSHTQCSAAVRDGTLTIEEKDGGKWYENISLFSVGSSSITVYLPKAEYAALTIEDDTGDVMIPSAFTFETVDVSSDTGDVASDASASGAVRIKTDTGHILMNGVSVGELTLSVTTGRVELRSVACEGDVRLSVTTGKAVLTDVSCRSFASGGDTGNISMENLIAAEGSTIERSAGDVTFEACDAAELLVTTDTGDVTGTLRSEKAFLTKTDTGRVEVPQLTAGGKCQITTDTGDIRLSVR